MNRLTIQENLQKYAHSIEELYENGKLDNAEVKISEFREYIAKQSDSTNLFIDFHSIKIDLLNAKIFEKQGNYRAAIKLSNEIFQKSIASGYDDFGIDSLLINANSLWRAGDFDTGLEIVLQGEELLSNVEDKTKSDFIEKEGRLSNSKGVILRFKGQLDSALLCFKMSLENFSKIKSQEDVSIALSNIGMIHVDKGDWGSALEYYKKSLLIEEKIGTTDTIGSTLNNIAVIHENINQLPEALKYYEKGFELYRVVGNKSNMGYSLNNIAGIYRNMGRLTQSLDYLKRSLELRLEVGNKETIANTLTNMGILNKDTGDLTTALANLKKSLELYEELANDIKTSRALFNLILVYLQIEDLSSDLILNQYLLNIQELNQRNENKILDERTKLAQALILKSKPRITEKTDAQKILQEIVNGEIIDGQLMLQAMFHYCELLLNELQLYGEDQVLQEAIDISNRMYKIAEDSNSYLLMVEVLILQSKFVLINGNIEKSLSIFDQALDIANRWDLQELIEKIKNEQMFILNELNKWKTLVETHSLLIERMKDSKIEELMSKLFVGQITDL